MSKLTFEEACNKHAQYVGYEKWMDIPKDARPYHVSRVAELMAMSWANEAVKDIFIFKTVDDWHEEDGACLFFATPVCESATVTSPMLSDWIDGYFTHYLSMRKFPVPDEDGSAIPGNTNDTSFLPYPEIEQ